LPEDDALDSIAEGADPPGDLVARRERERGLDLVLAGNEQAVHEIDPSCLDGHHHSQGFRFGIGALLDP
jgi:hypothetical protein